MTDRSSTKADHDKRPVTHSPNEKATQTILAAMHVLSERLTAMSNYFGAARADLAKADHRAADEMILRLLEQNERAREIAVQLRVVMRDRPL